MKSARNVIFILFCVICFGGFLGCEQTPSSKKVSESPKKVVSGSKKTSNKVAPSFRLQDDSEDWVSSEDLKGKVLLVHFWATWCAPCLPELPKMVEFAKKFDGTDLRLVIISIDENWEDAKQVFTDKLKGPSVVSLLDADAKISEKFGSFQFPETYLIDRDYSILAKWVGPQDWKNEFFEKKIREKLTN